MNTDDYRDDPVRSYVRTGGRSRPSRTLHPETLLVGTGLPVPIAADRQQRAVVELHQGVLSLAEAAAHLQLPVSLVAVLAADCIDSGHLSIHSPQPERREDPSPSPELLEKVLAGLRNL